MDHQQSSIGSGVGLLYFLQFAMLNTKMYPQLKSFVVHTAESSCQRFGVKSTCNTITIRLDVKSSYRTVEIFVENVRVIMYHSHDFGANPAHRQWRHLE